MAINAFSMGNMSLEAPQGYSVALLVLAGKAEEKFARNVVISRERVPPGTTVATYKQAQLKLLAEQSPGFSTVKSGTLSIDGAECPMIETETIGSGGLPLSSMLAYVIKGDVIFTLTATNPKGAAYTAAREEFVQIMKSFSAKV